MSYKGLTKAQQRLLEEEGEDCFDVDELPENILQKFASLNNHELMWQAANRFLADKNLVKAHSRSRKW